jgi:5-formyltetrahydrofolate cyclo-ligase
MQKVNPSILKIELRRKFIHLRQSLSAQRRTEAALAVRSAIIEKGNILSFHSFGSEIDLSLLNELLIREKRLILPKIENDLLVPYQVFDLKKSLQQAPWGGFEPHPDFSSKISPLEIHLILVPGLAFDRECFRLGYGKGHYDRFLKAIPHIETLGIGFHEQQTKELLPREAWDIPLKNCLFF